MKTLASLLTALALAVLLTVPAFAGGEEGGDTVTKTYSLTINGSVDDPEDRLFFGEHSAEGDGTDEAPVIIMFCGPDLSVLIPEGEDFEVIRADNYTEECVGDGRVYTASRQLEPGGQLYFGFSTALLSELRAGGQPEGFFTSDDGDDQEEPGDFEVVNTDTTNTAWYTFSDDQQAPQMPDTGAGGDTVTKTFEVTLYGDVPRDRSVAATYFTRQQVEAGYSGETIIIFCGQVPSEDLNPQAQVIRASTEDCKGGDGTTYTQEVELKRGTEITYLFATGPEDVSENYDGSEDVILYTTPRDQNFQPTEYEVVDENMTNSAHYDFDAEQGGEGSGPDAPGMPETGAGGMAHSGLPLGYAAVVLSLLLACGYLARGYR